MTLPTSVLIVGESVAGTTAARELRTLGYSGSLTVIGAEAEGAYSRPALSKQVLVDPAADAAIGYDVGGLDLDIHRSPAASLDTASRVVHTQDGRSIGYDSLIIATGATARRLAAPGQQGELVLRDHDDARVLRDRLGCADKAVVIGAGFLGMEVASACVKRGISVTVVDTEPPLERVLGKFLAREITARAEARGVRFIQTDGFAALAGNPVAGVLLPDGTSIVADLTVTCAGDLPTTSWLDGTGLADALGVGTDKRCATGMPEVFAAGDVTYPRGGHRAPFWSNAVAQGKVAAASVLGHPASCPPYDDYFWTEVLGISIKVVGPLPLEGPPRVLEGSLDEDRALLRWDRSAGGASTVVAFGLKKPVPRLRAMV